jgi:hypothetical protein
MKRVPSDTISMPAAAAHSPATGLAAIAPEKQGAWIRQLHASPRMQAQRRMLEASFGASAMAPVQRMMGFEFQVTNQDFLLRDQAPTSKEEKQDGMEPVEQPRKPGKPTNKEVIGRLDGPVAVERDGPNPEFVTDPFDESVAPDKVGECVSIISSQYEHALEMIATTGKDPRVQLAKRPLVPQIDVQATGGFSLAEVPGWLMTLHDELDKKGSPYFAKQGHKRYVKNISRLKEGMKTKARSYPDWQTAIPNELLSKLPPSVHGLMLLAQTNIQAVVAARDEITAPGVKALTAVLPKTNLSSLYQGMSDEDKRRFSALAEFIGTPGRHSWHDQQFTMSIPEKSNQLKWEYVKHWVFKPHLYPQDIVDGVEPMWVFEGFSEIGGGEDRAGMYKEFEETHGDSAEFSKERDKVSEKWRRSKLDPTKEAILEMRDFGSDKMKLDEIARWAAAAFSIYQAHKRGKT